MKSQLNVVLVYPQIPNNTGNIGRMCIGSNAKLHLIKPLGFELTDKYLKRAGLDYWQYLSYEVYEDIDDFWKKNPGIPYSMYSTHAEKTIWEHTYQPEEFLFFGCEATGLPEELTQKHSEHMLKIPLYDARVRSLNLSNATAVVVYEALRQFNSSR